jgi:hypothetical protein
MIAIIYQWRLHAGMEAQFEVAWSAVTALLKQQGSLGSALFDGPDGTVFAIARWPDLETRQASSARKANSELYAKMTDAIAEELQEHVIAEKLNFWS